LRKTASSNSFDDHTLTRNQVSVVEYRTDDEAEESRLSQELAAAVT